MDATRIYQAFPLSERDILGTAQYLESRLKSFRETGNCPNCWLSQITLYLFQMHSHFRQANQTESHISSHALQGTHDQGGYCQAPMGVLS